jgi:hypothetical protein
MTTYNRMRRSGFSPPVGPGRCRDCGFHEPTQGHRDGCPRIAGLYDVPPNWRELGMHERMAAARIKTTKPQSDPQLALEEE